MKTKPAKKRKSVIRKAYICRYCDAVYADAPVTQCDCLGELDGKPPHFIRGKITYLK